MDSLENEIEAMLHRNYGDENEHYSPGPYEDMGSASNGADDDVDEDESRMDAVTEVDGEYEEDQSSVSSLDGVIMYNNDYVATSDAGADNIPRYLMPTFASKLPEYTHLEVERITNSFRTGSLWTLKKLPARLQPGNIHMERKAHTLSNLIGTKVGDGPDTVGLRAFSVGKPIDYFAPLQYSSTDYSKGEEMHRANLEDERNRNASFCRKPFKVSSNVVSRIEEMFDVSVLKPPPRKKRSESEDEESSLPPAALMSPAALLRKQSSQKLTTTLPPSATTIERKESSPLKPLRHALHRTENKEKFIAGQFYARVGGRKNDTGIRNEQKVSDARAREWCKGLYMKIADDFPNLKFKVKYSPMGARESEQVVAGGNGAIGSAGGSSGMHPGAVSTSLPLKLLDTTVGNADPSASGNFGLRHDADKSAAELLVQFEVDSLPPEDVLWKYMNRLLTHGVASEYGLRRRGDRWGVVEKGLVVADKLVPKPEQVLVRIEEYSDYKVEEVFTDSANPYKTAAGGGGGSVGSNSPATATTDFGVKWYDPQSSPLMDRAGGAGGGGGVASHFGSPSTVKSATETGGVGGTSVGGVSILREEKKKEGLRVLLYRCIHTDTDLVNTINSAFEAACVDSKMVSEGTPKKTSNAANVDSKASLHVELTVKDPVQQQDNKAAEESKNTDADSEKLKRAPPKKVKSYDEKGHLKVQYFNETGEETDEHGVTFEEKRQQKLAAKAKAKNKKHSDSISAGTESANSPAKDDQKKADGIERSSLDFVIDSSSGSAELLYSRMNDAIKLHFGYIPFDAGSIGAGTPVLKTQGSEESRSPFRKLGERALSSRITRDSMEIPITTGRGNFGRVPHARSVSNVLNADSIQALASLRLNAVNSLEGNPASGNSSPVKKAPPKEVTLVLTFAGPWMSIPSDKTNKGDDETAKKNSNKKAAAGITAAADGGAGAATATSTSATGTATDTARDNTTATGADATASPASVSVIAALDGQPGSGVKWRDSVENGNLHDGTASLNTSMSRAMKRVSTLVSSTARRRQVTIQFFASPSDNIEIISSKISMAVVTAVGLSLGGNRKSSKQRGVGSTRTSMLGDALREKISRITGNLGGNIDRNSFTISEDGANLDSSRRQSNPNAPGNVRPVADDGNADDDDDDEDRQKTYEVRADGRKWAKLLTFSFYPPWVVLGQLHVAKKTAAEIRAQVRDLKKVARRKERLIKEQAEVALFGATTAVLDGDESLSIGAPHTAGQHGHHGHAVGAVAMGANGKIDRRIASLALQDVGGLPAARALCPLNMDVIEAQLHTLSAGQGGTGANRVDTIDTTRIGSGAGGVRHMASATRSYGLTPSKKQRPSISATTSGASVESNDARSEGDKTTVNKNLSMKKLIINTVNNAITGQSPFAQPPTPSERQGGGGGGGLSVTVGGGGSSSSRAGGGGINLSPRTSRSSQNTPKAGRPLSSQSKRSDTVIQRSISDALTRSAAAAPAMTASPSYSSKFGIVQFSGNNSVLTDHDHKVEEVIDPFTQHRREMHSLIDRTAVSLTRRVLTRGRGSSASTLAEIGLSSGVGSKDSPGKNRRGKTLDNEYMLWNGTGRISKPGEHPWPSLPGQTLKRWDLSHIK